MWIDVGHTEIGSEVHPDPGLDILEEQVERVCVWLGLSHSSFNKEEFL